MTRFNHLFQRLKRGIAFLLAVILTVQPFWGLDLGSISAFGAETQGRSSSFAYYDSSNLLKPGASFHFYGKDHNRVGLWPYGLTNVEGNKSAPGYCLEPNKSMRTGTGGTLVTYDLDLDGDNLPLGLTREEAEILWYALSSSGNFEGYQSNVGKVGQGHYCLYNGVKTLAFQAKPLGQPHTSKFRKKKYRDTKLEVKKWKTIESQHIVRMISNIT